MDIRQAADYLGIGGDTLYRYASKDLCPHSKLENRWRFRKSLLDNWMDVEWGCTEECGSGAHKKKPVASAQQVAGGVDSGARTRVKWVSSAGQFGQANAAVDVELQVLDLELALDIFLTAGRKDQRAEDGEAYLAVGVA